MARISIERQLEIDQKIAEMYFQTDLAYPQHTLLQIAEKLGLDVLSVDLGTTDTGKPIHGALKFPDHQGKPIILLDRDLSPERRSFTLAHELGHYILDHKPDNEELWRVDTYDYSEDTEQAEQESEANYFAGSLLMPREKLLSLLEFTNNNYRVVAKYFGVSEGAVRVRYTWIQQNNLKQHES